jgi:hypothetical protein
MRQDWRAALDLAPAEPTADGTRRSLARLLVAAMATLPEVEYRDWHAEASRYLAEHGRLTPDHLRALGWPP